MTAINTGCLVSIEGISGTGKTYLTHRVLQEIAGEPPIVLEEFSRRAVDRPADPARQILRALIHEGDYFLRGGRPKSETLLLFSIKTHDYEQSVPLLQRGHTVFEGRSLHSVAVYQAIILKPFASERQALQLARELLSQAADWRPLPDLTILLSDDRASALARAESRDRRRYTNEEMEIHRKAERLFAAFAQDDPQRIQVLNRMQLNEDEAVQQICTWVDDAAQSARSTEMSNAFGITEDRGRIPSRFSK